MDLDGQTGFVLPDDLEPTDAVPPWAALLPPLDPTTMGWSERGWYLGPHKADLFDTSGNAGPTIWWDGRIVGGWRQREGGDVELQLLEDIGAEGRQAVEHRGRPAHGLVRRPADPSPLPVTAVEGHRRPALTVSRSAIGAEVAARLSPPPASR